MRTCHFTAVNPENLSKMAMLQGYHSGNLAAYFVEIF